MTQTVLDDTANDSGAHDLLIRVILLTPVTPLIQTIQRILRSMKMGMPADIDCDDSNHTLVSVGFDIALAHLSHSNF